MPAPSPHPTSSSPVQPLRRSFTLPSKLTPSKLTSKHRQSLESENASRSPDASEHLIFSHTSVRIVQFTPPSTSVRPTSSPLSPDLDYPVDAIETLPWKSRMEMPVSTGSLKIEKVAGSAAFLKSGSVVHPMLKNSQCWCVDGNSIFVLRVRRLKYYRIELPCETPEDRKLVEDFKSTLSKILRYEVTPCPFQRGFTVELPEEAKTPRRKKAWRPKQLPTGETDDMKLDGEDQDPKTRELSDYGAIEEGVDTDSTDDSGATPRGQHLDNLTDEPSSSPVSIPVRTATRTLATHQPSLNSLVARFQPLPESDSEPDTDGDADLDGDTGIDVDVDVDSASLASSIDSFHSFQTPISPPPLPSPPYSGPPSPSPQRGFSIPELHPPPVRHHHTRDVSDITVTPEPPTSSGPPVKDSPHQEPAMLAPLIIPQQWQPRNGNNTEDRLTFPVPDLNPSIRNRVKASRRRDLSPLPPSSTLFNPSPKSPGNHLTASILQKTCTIVLGPPIHFIAMLIHIAARIAGAEGEGPSFVGDLNQRSQQRELEDSDDPSLSEDDFGLPLNMVGSYRHSEPRDDGSDPWDLD